MNTNASKPTPRRFRDLLAVLIGCASGPFIFHAAGLGNFATFEPAHITIIVCYQMGAVTLARWLIAGIEHLAQRGHGRSGEA